MNNPWLKKNPFMSMYLSGANAITGSIRGKAAAAVKRHAAVATKTAAQDFFSFWSGAALTGKPKKKTRRK